MFVRVSVCVVQYFLFWTVVKKCLRATFIVQTIGEAKILVFEAQICYLIALWLWANFYISLSLCFLIYEICSCQMSHGSIKHLMNPRPVSVCAVFLAQINEDSFLSSTLSDFLTLKKIEANFLRNEMQFLGIQFDEFW